MITTGGKLWFAVAFYALVAAAVYHVATGRGDDGGTFTLLFLAAGAASLGGISVATRDGDAGVTGTDDAREAVAIRSALPAPWPAVAALGAGLTIVGYAAGGMLLYGGFGLMGIALVEWMVQGWAERSTADPAYNAALRNRIMLPIEVPALGFLGVAFVILTFSRVLLALPDKNVSTAIAIGVAVLIMAVATLLATRPRVPEGTLSWLLAVGAVVLLAAGVISGVSGEREIEAHHEPEAHGENEGEHEGEGNAGTNDPSEGTVGDDGSHDDAEEPAE